MYRLISPVDLKERLAADNPPAVVDLRDEAAFVEGHVPGAMMVPSGIRVERWIPQRIATTRDIVLCDGGGEDHRASHEASHLSHLWYHGILVLQGGFAAWKEAELEVEDGAPVDPLGVGRRIEPRMPPAGVIPDEFAPEG